MVCLYSAYGCVLDVFQSRTWMSYPLLLSAYVAQVTATICSGLSSSSKLCPPFFQEVLTWENKRGFLYLSMLSRCRTFCPALQNNEFLQSYTNHFNLCGKGTLRCRTGIPEDSLRWLRLPDCIKSVWSELLWIGRCCSSVCQQAGVEQDTDLEVLDICSSLRKKKAELEIAPTKWKPVWISVQVMVTVWPLCWQNMNSWDALVAVSVTAYRLNGASLSMLSFWSLNKLFIMVISVFFFSIPMADGWNEHVLIS